MEEEKLEIRNFLEFEKGDDGTKMEFTNPL